MTDRNDHNSFLIIGDVIFTFLEMSKIVKLQAAKEFVPGLFKLWVKFRTELRTCFLRLLIENRIAYLVLS